MKIFDLDLYLMRSFQMTDESAKLLSTQQQLEKEADGKIAFFGLSVNETIRTLLLNGMTKRADKMKSDFKLPDKRYVAILVFLCPQIYRINVCSKVLAIETACAYRGSGFRRLRRLLSITAKSNWL